MHAIQTSGNCIRNTTTDQFAGVSPEEIEDSRPYCELIRQWSSFHPEFAYLPRKFKIAVCGTQTDQAATQVHDIGIYLKKDSNGKVGFQILAGGGLGRTPVIGKEIFEFVEKPHLLTALEAILRVYNRLGRRDNKYKARIKIVVKETGVDEFKKLVMQEWLKIKNGPLTVTEQELKRCKNYFIDPSYEELLDSPDTLTAELHKNVLFRSWFDQNVSSHKRPGYSIVTICFKETGIAPGDISDVQLNRVAYLADEYSFSEVRVTHHQNIVLANVKQSDLPSLWHNLNEASLSTANLGLLTDMICCPGGDFCALANAKSLPIAESIQRQFPNELILREIGALRINISGCMNACGHHHVGNIGILGVDKKGEEFYQISLGGSSRNQASIGKIIGPAFSEREIPVVIQTIVDTYLSMKTPEEEFIDTYKRVGIEPFKEKVYANTN